MQVLRTRVGQGGQTRWPDGLDSAKLKEKQGERGMMADGLAIGRIRESGGWAKWASSDQTGKRVDMAQYCTLSIRSRTGTVTVLQGRGGQAMATGGNMRDQVTHQDNRLSCKSQKLQKAKDNRFEDSVECDCDSRKGSLVQEITCGT